MSRFTGKQGKGAQRAAKAVRRVEAEHRQALTLHENTRAHRLGKCDCVSD